MAEAITEARQAQYIELIQELMICPNGQEPEVLDAQPDLIDAGFVQTLVQVSSMMAHENNPDGARFLIYIARELAKQLGLYPEKPNDDQ
ncbi:MULTISPECIES: hypothetical protein [Leptolyngbya]|uniref:Uncharacterized protein n=1 Tax=Leptolyngbya boryana CZ1 TaxID=3060204 RepID=A0AA96WVV8_LEPBY|nr:MULTISPECIES: hypothetical protein [Leptolyngbya]MBN8562867.1 hypothetical protein [Leptolyngbya sp. UWPOB_LEPTO1]MCY6493683.1 hypothetical protein [Leptolyngbya sp. GGD]WNZ46906.1 hypothetical protein Q2T42_03505 [Leptolyngbya boryana CZ1]